MANMWDDEAEFYDRFSQCEYEDTKVYLDLLGIKPKETVLDVCCGPGRISVLAAPLCKRVTAFDSSEQMLRLAQRNAKACGVSNIDFQLLCWEDAASRLEKHDVVIASRNLAITEYKALSALSNRLVMLQIFADSPSIPRLLDMLYAGCMEDGELMPVRPRGEHRKDGGGKRHSGFMDLVNGAYQAGYLPNVRIMPERFKKRFDSENEAIDFICSLKPARAKDNRERIAGNAVPFLARTADGHVEFCIETKAAIIWWEV